MRILFKKYYHGNVKKGAKRFIGTSFLSIVAVKIKYAHVKVYDILEKIKTFVEKNK